MASTSCTCRRQRRGTHTNQWIANQRQRVWRTVRKAPGEAATLSIPDEPYGPRSDPDLRKDTLLREISDWHHQSLQLATPCFSSSGLTDARHCRRKSPVNQRNQRRKTCRYRWNGEGWRTEAKGRKKKKEGWRRRTEQQTCRQSSPP